ncbi:MAG: hypothetical protein PQJ47_03890 [Sphaerochaetaceae bacterium]|nr:hypothetical protein [Sphaerochaetaceae bacterium]
MSLLKSAWEIALERTEGIEADSDKIRKDGLIDKGKRIAGTYLSDIEATFEQLESNVKEHCEEDRPFVIQGLSMTLLANVALPQNDEFKERIERMQRIASVIDGEEGDSVELLGQIASFMEKYLEAKETLLERARAQYKPMFEQKKQQMMSQYGRSTYSSMEQDPEFIQFIQKNYNQLADQYQQTLDGAKDQLKEKWNLE